MFLYIKDYFQKRIFHILLIIFCGLLMFNSIMTLVDLKNYWVGIDYSQNDRGYHIEKVDEKRQITFGSPVTIIGYEFDGMRYKSGWVGRKILEQNMKIESYIVEYKVYDGTGVDNLIDSFTIDFSTPQQPITKEYETRTSSVISGISVSSTIVDYNIKFDTSVYVPHIFVIVGCLFFIVPSAVMLFKIRKEENGK